MLIRVRNIYLSFAFKYINDIRSIIIVVDNTGIKGNFSSRRVETICCGTRSREKKREREMAKVTIYNEECSGRSVPYIFIGTVYRILQFTY